MITQSPIIFIIRLLLLILNKLKVITTYFIVDSYLSTEIGRSASSSSMLQMASSMYLGPHQARAPVQKETQVNPKVERTKLMLQAKLFKSFLQLVAFSWNERKKIQFLFMFVDDILRQCFSNFFKSRNLSKFFNHLAEPKCSIQYYLQHILGTQPEICGTSGFRGTQVENHSSKGSTMCHTRSFYTQYCDIAINKYIYTYIYIMTNQCKLLKNLTHF